MSDGDETQSVDEAVALIWRKTLWILEALPPRRARDAVGGVLRQRKLTRYLSEVLGASGAARRALGETITGEIPFVILLMWWASEREVEHPALLGVSQLQIGTGNAFVRLAGSRPAAHAALTAFARKRANGRDDAFSEASIRSQVVEELQKHGTAFGSAIGLPDGGQNA